MRLPTIVLFLAVALLSIATLVAIAMFGTGIYSADASADHVVVDGYGVSAPAH